MNSFKKYLPVAIAVVFILFCIVQYNDPDPLVWIAIYGYVSIVSLLVRYKKANRLFIVCAMPLYLLGSWYLWPGTYEGITMSMGYKPGIEEARESLGLLIAFFSLGLLFLIDQRQSKTSILKTV